MPTFPQTFNSAFTQALGGLTANLQGITSALQQDFGPFQTQFTTNVSSLTTSFNLSPFGSFGVIPAFTTNTSAISWIGRHRNDGEQRSRRDQFDEFARNNGLELGHSLTKQQLRERESFRLRIAIINNGAFPGRATLISEEAPAGFSPHVLVGTSASRQALNGHLGELHQPFGPAGLLKLPR